MLVNGSETDEVLENGTTSNAWIYKFVGLVELFVAIVGTLLNTFVLLAACSKPKGMSLKSRRTITECLVISMSMADLIFTVCHAPLGFMYFYLQMVLNPWQCHFFYAATHISIIASSLSLLWLNVNKFLQLHRPLHYFLYMTKSRALIFIAVGWSISIGWGMFFVFGPFLSYDGVCNARLQYPEVYIFFATEFFLVPTVVSLFVSVDVALLVLGEKKRQFRENFLRFRPSRVPLDTARQYQHAVDARKRRFRNALDPSNVRRVTFVFATTMWSALTVLPYRFAYTVHILPGYKTTNFGVTVSFCFFALMALNAAGNPFITMLTHKHYAKFIHDWFKCKWRCNQSEKQNPVKC